jgi:hypothetical protein
MNGQFIKRQEWFCRFIQSLLKFGRLLCSFEFGRGVGLQSADLPAAEEYWSQSLRLSAMRSRSGSVSSAEAR